MAILNAIIENKGNTLIIDFPHSIYDVYEKLLSIGIRKSPNDIMLTDNEDDDIQVKLYSDSDFGNHVIRLLGEDNSLADANTTAYLLMTADDELKDELEQNILYDQYDSIQELTADIKKMKDMLGQFKISFFCPLDGNIEDSEYSEMQSAGNWYLKSYDLRYSDEKGQFISIEPKVGVNHGGTVLMRELLDFREKGYLSFTDETSPNFLGYDLTPREFMETDPLQEEENEQQFGGMQL